MNILFVDGHADSIKAIPCQKDDRWIPAHIKKYNYMFWPDLKLPGADEKPNFWGPGY